MGTRRQSAGLGLVQQALWLTNPSSHPAVLHTPSPSLPLLMPNTLYVCLMHVCIWVCAQMYMRVYMYTCMWMGGIDSGCLFQVLLTEVCCWTQLLFKNVVVRDQYPGSLCCTVCTLPTEPFPQPLDMCLKIMLFVA